MSDDLKSTELTALAMLRSGLSFAEASRSTHVAADRLQTLWELYANDKRAAK
jgi:hypothetical protein